MFWLQGRWNLSFPSRDQTPTPHILRGTLNHWMTREVPHTTSNKLCSLQLNSGLQIPWLPTEHHSKSKYSSGRTRTETSLLTFWFSTAKASESLRNILKIHRLGSCPEISDSEGLCLHILRHTTPNW